MSAAASFAWSGAFAAASMMADRMLWSSFAVFFVSLNSVARRSDRAPVHGFPLPAFFFAALMSSAIFVAVTSTLSDLAPPKRTITAATARAMP